MLAGHLDILSIPFMHDMILVGSSTSIACMGHIRFVRNGITEGFDGVSRWIYALHRQSGKLD